MHRCPSRLATPAQRASRLALPGLAAVLATVLACSEPPAEPAPPRAERTVPEEVVARRVHDLLLMPDPMERYAALIETLQGLGPGDSGSVIDAVESVFLVQQDPEAMIIASWLGSVAPEAGLEWARSDGTTIQPVIANRLLYHWARHDPESARAILPTLSRRIQREASRGIIEGWEASGKDPEGLVSFLSELGIGSARQEAIFLVAWRKTIREGPEATMAWAEAVPDEGLKFKLDVYRHTAGALAALAPEAAARFAEKHMTGPWGDNVARMVASRWARRDGAAALGWALSLPEHEQKTLALEEGFRKWLRVDFPAAIAWAEALDPNDPTTEPIRAIHINATSPQDPAAALDRLDTITDRERRELTLIRIVKTWRNRDPEAADAWLASHEVSEEARQRILGPPPGATQGRAAGEDEEPDEEDDGETPEASG